MMVRQKTTGLQFDTLMAVQTLTKMRKGDCSKKAKAAELVLGDTILFQKYITEIKLRRAKKSRNKEEKSLTLWKRCVSMLLRRNA